MTLNDLPAIVESGPILEAPAWAIWLACDYTSNRHAGLDVLRLEPYGEDQVQISGCTPVSAIQLRLPGHASRVVLLPGKALKGLRQRHRDAELLAVKPVNDLMLSVRTFSESCTVAWSLPEGQTCFERFPEMPTTEVLEKTPVGFDPALLRTACGGLTVLQDVKVAVLQQKWGLQLKLKGEEMEGQIILLGKRSAEQ